MNSTLASADFARSRRPAEPSNQPLLGRTARNLFTKPRLWLGKVASSAFARILMIFVIGFAAGWAWTTYSGAARKAIAGWSPRLAWLAPAAAPAGPSAERLRAASLAVGAARQSIDKAAIEISKLQAQGTSESRSRRASHRP